MDDELHLDGVYVQIYRSKIDKRIVVEISTPDIDESELVEGSPNLRVLINECTIYSSACKECRDTGDTVGNCPHGNDALTSTQE